MIFPLSILKRRGLIAAGVLGVVAHALLFFSGWPTVAGVLILGILLPGLLAAAWWLRRILPTALEFALYALGLGYILYVLILLSLSVLPGGLAPWQVVVAMDALCLLLALGWWRAWRLPATAADWQPPDLTWDRWAIVGLASVLVTGALLRLPDLGYSEFLYDEIRIVHRAAEIIQGYSPALILHRKGPTEILIPTGIYAVQQAITEAHARFPFALANLAGLAAIYLLGWRMFGKVAGWAAAMLLAVDGFFIGFSRFTQYQSIIFLMTVLIVLALHRQARSNRVQPAYLWIAGLCFVTGMYAHYEALWAIVPGLYFLWVYGARTEDWRGLLRAAVGPVFVSSALLLAFYVPFLLDTRWQSTVNNIFGKRIGGDFPYNNLRDFLDRATIYDSAYQILFMIVGALLAQALILRRGWPRWVAWTASALTLAGMALTFFVRPDWLRVGETDYTWLFFTLAIGVVVVTPCIRDEERATWLWFGVPMIVSLFVVAEPNTHVYGFFLGWVLVVGAALEQCWEALRATIGLIPARRLALPVATVVVAIFANYTFWFFTYTDAEILRTWRENRLWGYWTPYELPSRDSLYGFPYKNGWKVIGALYADGTLDAPFDANEAGRIADWYSRGPYVCPPEAEYYVLPTKLQPNEQNEVTEKLGELAALGYQEWGYVTVNDDPRLRIFTSRPVDGPPRVFDEADYAPIFDATLTSPYFIKAGPALLTQPATPINYRLGEHTWLKGYTLPHTQVAPGDKLPLELYWEVTQYSDSEDKTFVQIINLDTLHKAAQRDSEPGCGKYAIDDWRAGDLNFDPYTLTIAPDAPPGNYTVLVGIYDEETEERYPVFAADGAQVGDFVPLTTIEIRND
jgi:hypothetical protein